MSILFPIFAHSYKYYKVQEIASDILENDILRRWPEVLRALLKDHTTNRNIFWATDMYEKEYGESYSFKHQITIEQITGSNGTVIRPRAVKSIEEQRYRIRDKAEVFTPSWICNAQNNLVDDAWFGRDNVFNTLDLTTHEWAPTEGKILFPENRTWQEYVCRNDLEITCGEAPYLASRYDTTTGVPFTELKMRIGLLDRKLRVVGENVRTMKDWYFWAFNAVKSIYGYEWQGDSLLLAREAILYTFIDYYKEFAKNHRIKTVEPFRCYLLHVAKIISWNLFQMDGLKMVLPMTCYEVRIKGEPQTNLFSKVNHKDKVIPCPGCKKNDVHLHNGIKVKVADWNKSSWNLKEKPVEIVEFHTLLKKP